MACSSVPVTPTLADLRRRALDRLRAGLASGAISVRLSSNGSIAFAGWNGERGGLYDLCAYRVLSAEGNPDLRRAIARAEALAGRKVNLQAIAAGEHSHDGGRTWGSH